MQELYVKYQTRDDAPKERDPYRYCIIQEYLITSAHGFMYV
jgi:hypothetical protein